MELLANRRNVCGGLVAAGLLGAGAARARQAAGTAFRNVRVFDGKTPRLSAPTDVVIQNNTIAAIGAGAAVSAGTVIEGGGRTLMPGMIDAHWHLMMAETPQQMMMMDDPNYVHMRATREARSGLMRGFTTIRDLGGPVFGLKRAIDEGILPGPRIYPSGAMISQTSGHGDFRFTFELPREPGGALSHSEALGATAIADSPDEVRLRAREQLRLGASQIKLMAGGGVSSPHNPIESLQFTEAELRAGVEAAEDWGTYVTVHAYTPGAIQRAIRAGVKCIDHGQLADEETVRMMADKGVWWSLQPLTYNAEVFQRMSPFSQEKALEVFAGTEKAYEMVKRLNMKVGWGADILFDAAAAARQGSYVAMMSRWFSPAQTLKMVTADNGELMALSALCNPYPGAKLGVVETGAFADLLLVDGDPLQNLDLVADPETNFKVIMKDGTVFKNTLPGPLPG